MDQIKSMEEITQEVDEIASNIEKTFEGNDGDDLIGQDKNRIKRRTALIQSTTNGSTSAQNPVYLEWYGLNYSVSTDNESKKYWTFGSQNDKLDLESNESNKHLRTIIENIHGCANPGEILAIMGPSGCGKTTLLNLLGDRVGSKGVQGTITMNGHKPTKDSKKHVAYCTQDDIFFPQLTVRDTLGFTARLRLPREMPRRDKLKQVENTMQLLHLTKCADTRIGDGRIRGVSGGERKRVSIASELLTDPSVILLDEPTSGLDSSLALELARILKEIAVKQKKTVVMVIHQPSSYVFNVFDKLMLMADGHMIYFGERDGIVDYLADQGFKCNPNFNPADYILELLNDNNAKKTLINSYAHHIKDDPTGKQVTKKYSHRSRDTKDDDIINVPVKSKHRWEATYLQQILILTERTFKQRRRNILSKIDVFQTLALAIVCCLVWFQIPYNEEHISDRIGAIFFTTIFWTFHPLIGAITAFTLDLEMLSKERHSRSYRLSSYFLSKQIAELPLSLFHPIVFIIIVYWALGFLPDFGRFVAHLMVVLLTTLTSQSFGYFFGATLLNIQKSMSIGTVYMLATMILGGFYVKHLPSGMIWLKHLSFSKYAFGLVTQIQFDSPKAIFKCGSPGIGQTSLCDSKGLQRNYIPGVVILNNEHLDEFPWYVNLIILLLFCIFVRVLAYFSLRKNTRGNKRK